jgi:hypothetical protein
VPHQGGGAPVQVEIGAAEAGAKVVPAETLANG